MAGAWGETVAPGVQTGLADGTRRMTEDGGWHALKIRPAGMAALLKSPKVTAAVQAKTEAMTNFAQSISVTKDAYYEAKVLYKDHPHWPARGFVVAENYKAVIDDMYHSTLLKTAAHFPSDVPFEHMNPGPTPTQAEGSKPHPTARSSTRKDGLWVDRNGRWRNQKGHYQRAPDKDE